MRKRRWLSALALVTALCCLASCSSLTSAPRDLLQAPKATGDVGEIQRALFDYAGSNIALRFPHSGDNRTAFFLADLDGDGTDEALAFYAAASSADEESVEAVHINLIDRVNGVWRSVFDAVTPGNAIDKVEVADLSGDGRKTLLVGVQLFGAVGNQLNLYTYDGKILTQQAQENYTQFLIGDLMDAGSDQLLVLSLDSTEHISTVTVYSFDGETMVKRGVAATDGNISGYTQAMIGTLAGGQPALFLDAAKSALTLVTDVVYFGENGLVSPFTTLGETQYTLRHSAELCRDVDGDGVTDLPFTELLPGYAERSEADRLYLTIWRRFDGKQVTDVLCADVFTAAGFQLAFPSRWRGSVTLVSDSASRMRSYRIYDEEKQTAGAEILRIRAYDTDVYERFDHEGTILLDRNDTTVWVARLVMTEGPYAITQEELQTLFSVL